MRTALGTMAQVQVRTVYLKPTHMVRLISNHGTSEIYFAVVISESLSLEALHAHATSCLNTSVPTLPLAIIAR